MRLTPLERLEEMYRLMVELEEARGHGDDTPERAKRTVETVKDLADLAHIREIRNRRR